MPRRLFAAALLVAVLVPPAAGQPYKVLPLKGSPEARAARLREAEALRQLNAAPGTKTTVTVELLTGRLGGGLHAQEWAAAFRDIGFDGLVRQERSTDKLGVFEETRGTLRSVRVVGRLDVDGSVRFEDRRIGLDDRTRLSEWLTELRTYGVQGSPAGKPMWGLNGARFDALLRDLAEPTEFDLEGRPFLESLPKLETPAALPVRLTEDARDELAKLGREATIRVSTAGFSQGTALALVLRDRGFGFRPNRTPAGSLELVIDPLAKIADPWPVGWEFEGSRQESMPKMFAFVPVRLEDSKLVDVLDVIAARTEVPIVLDRTGIEEAGIEIDALRTSYPERKTSWSLLLRNVLGPHELIREFRTDEAGTVFCWVTVFRPRVIEAE